ncbi:hypothetical protein HCH_00930 [Hahella chejuensis KCTC 2396]|uniref:Uncharacterized protein n=1 Tax=Hahella chejuensis (strain KCTC 2396) TaxID=349521 RepID=Q2SNF4_HAHCH|nr:hypothetical protein HCH_00930 [Hahella chejuensis KCTC 2396]
MGGVKMAVSVPQELGNANATPRNALIARHL